jgi:hypothetical protein
MAPELDAEAIAALQKKFDDDIDKAHDLFDAGDPEGCIAQCDQNLQVPELGPWWKIANLILIVCAKDEWDEQAEYCFYAAPAAITRQEVLRIMIE